MPEVQVRYYLWVLVDLYGGAWSAWVCTHASDDHGDISKAKNMCLLPCEIRQEEY